MAQNGRKGRGGRKGQAPAKPETLTFDYIKSNYFRVIQVDGIVGGVAPSGRAIHMAAWNQRAPYPQQVVHELSSEGVLGKETARKGREANYIRELEAGLVFSPEMARVIIRWLTARLEELDAAGVATDSEGEDKQ